MLWESVQSRAQVLPSDVDQRGASDPLLQLVLVQTWFFPTERSAMLTKLSNANCVGHVLEPASLKNEKGEMEK